MASHGTPSTGYLLCDHHCPTNVTTNYFLCTSGISFALWLAFGASLALLLLYMGSNIRLNSTAFRECIHILHLPIIATPVRVASYSQIETTKDKLRVSMNKESKHPTANEQEYRRELSMNLLGSGLRLYIPEEYVYIGLPRVIIWLSNYEWGRTRYTQGNLNISFFRNNRIEYMCLQPLKGESLPSSISFHWYQYVLRSA